jgi:hypothetical protein
MQAFERYMTKAKFVFVENMDEFYASPTPKTGGSAPYSLGADDPKFLAKVKTANIMYAYPSRA